MFGGQFVCQNQYFACLIRIIQTEATCCSRIRRCYCAVSQSRLQHLCPATSNIFICTRRLLYVRRRSGTSSSEAEKHTHKWEERSTCSKLCSTLNTRRRNHAQRLWRGSWRDTPCYAHASIRYILRMISCPDGFGVPLPGNARQYSSNRYHLHPEIYQSYMHLIVTLDSCQLGLGSDESSLWSDRTPETSATWLRNLFDPHAGFVIEQYAKQRGAGTIQNFSNGTSAYMAMVSV